jgi:hypothetical protein
MSLTDTLGSLAVASQGQYMTGVSTDISTSFVRPAGLSGDQLKMKATLTAMGTLVVLQSRLLLPSPYIVFFFVPLMQVNRSRTRGSISPTRRGSWSPTGVSPCPPTKKCLVSSIVSLTEAPNQPIPSILAGQLATRYAIQPRFPVLLPHVFDKGERQVLSGWREGHRGTRRRVEVPIAHLTAPGP